VVGEKVEEEDDDEEEASKTCREDGDAL